MSRPCTLATLVKVEEVTFYFTFLYNNFSEKPNDNIDNLVFIFVVLMSIMRIYLWTWNFFILMEKIVIELCLTQISSSVLHIVTRFKNLKKILLNILWRIVSWSGNIPKITSTFCFIKQTHKSHTLNEVFLSSSFHFFFKPVNTALRWWWRKKWKKKISSSSSEITKKFKIVESCK